MSTGVGPGDLNLVATVPLTMVTFSQINSNETTLSTFIQIGSINILPPVPTQGVDPEPQIDPFYDYDTRAAIHGNVSPKEDLSVPKKNTIVPKQRERVENRTRTVDELAHKWECGQISAWEGPSVGDGNSTSYEDGVGTVSRFARSHTSTTYISLTAIESAQSDAGRAAPPTRSLQGGCKYEVAPSYLKRRIPYSEGSDTLEPPSESIKERLSTKEDEKLTKAMKDLYGRLLPTPESEQRRSKLVQKLENILKTRWPGYQIKVNVFGSTGNKLGTSDSDVDICVTTNCKPIENVCNLAELCARKGMERVVCIAGAKVPIVKIWDPEWQLACDINVNQYIAMENTAMIRTYVELDDRVRPLAMVIKHWTRKRILNDAGKRDEPRT
ncbi:putative pap 25a associated domain-containing protein [Phaeomoniella chlamydospora]|uniref:Putative pap 25a associated domain-containing protein n=1 Tax=Phaeomoniella chlamydospora TaxID=158046 RepID=A0A0G2ETU5_PHACM|nr:putative pap 25a associated domain-containing protein [Phaeomoniella chlamydospora]